MAVPARGESRYIPLRIVSGGAPDPAGGRERRSPVAAAHCRADR